MPPRKRRNVVAADKTDSNEKAPITKLRKRTDCENPEPTDVLYWPFNKQALLGKGSFGKVEIWYHHSSTKIVAAKVMSDVAYRTELEHVRNLRHENIVKYITSFDDKKTIIFELVSYTLEQLINDRIENNLGLSEYLIKTLIGNMSCALEYLVNGLKVVHRDIKPANILFDSEHKTFLLADLGVATSYDSDSKQYSATPAGTKYFMKPSLYERIEKWDEIISVSIDTELWPLALTYFYAATGKHPFCPTKLRNTWLRLARDKQKEYLCIDEKGQYKNDFYSYNRLSVDFSDKVLKPLLLSMMSDEASFKDYFSRVSTMMYSDTVYIFDVTNFKLCALPYQFDIDDLETVVKNHFDYKHIKLAYDLNILSLNNTSLNMTVPRTQEKSPIVLYSLTEGNEPSIKTDLSYLIYQLDESTKKFFDSRDIYKSQEIKCVFTNTLNNIDESCEKIQYLLTTMNLYIHTIRERQGELRLQFKTFETQNNQYFKLHQPHQEFKNMILSLEDRVKKALVPLEINDIREVNIRHHADVESFRQHIELLMQRKLIPENQEHVLQCRKVMTKAANYVLEFVTHFIQRYVDKINYCDRFISVLDKLISETTFAQSELHSVLVNEIQKIGKK